VSDALNAATSVSVHVTSLSNDRPVWLLVTICRRRSLPSTRLGWRVSLVTMGRTTLVCWRECYAGGFCVLHSPSPSQSCQRLHSDCCSVDTSPQLTACATQNWWLSDEPTAGQISLPKPIVAAKFTRLEPFALLSWDSVGSLSQGPSETKYHRWTEGGSDLRQPASQSLRHGSIDKAIGQFSNWLKKASVAAEGGHLDGNCNVVTLLLLAWTMLYCVLAWAFLSVWKSLIGKAYCSFDNSSADNFTCRKIAP